MKNLTVLGSCINCKLTTRLIFAFVANLNQLLPIPDKVDNLAHFIITLTTASQVSSVVIYIAMIYLVRLKPLLIGCTGLPTTLHRLALAAIILAEKSVCDVAMKNKFWASHSKLFTLDQVNLIERQMLSLLVRT